MDESSRELPSSAKDRTQFLGFLAASPCLAAVGGMGGMGPLPLSLPCLFSPLQFVVRKRQRVIAAVHMRICS
jgi:hypothetical protein